MKDGSSTRSEGKNKSWCDIADSAGSFILQDVSAKRQFHELTPGADVVQLLYRRMLFCPLPPAAACGSGIATGNTQCANRRAVVLSGNLLRLRVRDEIGGKARKTVREYLDLFADFGR